MTPLEHERWMRVARSSKRGRWYVPRHPSGAEGRMLGELFRRVGASRGHRPAALLVAALGAVRRRGSRAGGGVMRRCRIMPPRNGCGPRVVVPLGGVEHSLTISEATDLHNRIGEALLRAAKLHGEIDPRIVEDDDD